MIVSRTVSFIVVLIFGNYFAWGGFNEDQLAMMKNLHNQCVAETGVSEDVVAECMKGNFQEDPKAKCYMKCIFDEMGLVGEDGTMDSEGMIAVLPDDLVAKVSSGIRKCGTVFGSDVCDTVFQTNKCYHKEFPNEYFLI